MFHGPGYENMKIVYIYEAEAHATDVWPIGLSAGAANKRHVTIEDRARCAQNFINEFQLDCLDMHLDAIGDTFLHTFSSWPFKYFIIKFDEAEGDFKFFHIGDPEDSSFDLFEIPTLLAGEH